MNRILLVTAFILGCVSTAFAEVKAVITGPEKASAGDLVVLSGSDSVGDGFRWMLPQRIQTITCGDGLELAFASGTPGTYQFTLIAADSDAAIDYITHTVQIVGRLPPEVDEPEEPPVEPEPNPGQFDELVKLSQRLAEALHDADTAEALAKSIGATSKSITDRCSNGQCPGLDVAKAEMVATIERTLLARTGASQRVDWLTGWREPVNAALRKINAADVPTYLLAMRAAAFGLSSAR